MGDDDNQDDSRVEVQGYEYMNESLLSSRNYEKWALLFLALFIFIFVAKSPVSHTGSDPRGSLLLSGVIIEDQSVKLDEYIHLNEYIHNIQKKNDHYYYYFPIGSSISSLPFVWFETKVLHNKMDNVRHEGNAQKRIAGFISALIFLLLYAIAGLYFNARLSIAIAFLFWLSTSLASTLGQALWSQDFASLYALLSIFLMLKIIRENKDIYWIFLGSSLFMAYLTRPTMSLLSIAVILYLLVNERKFIAFKAAGLTGALLGCFVIFSVLEFNQLLPDYYLPKRLESETFWTAFLGNLFSPARGLFIFSPFLLIFIIDIKGTYSIFKNNKSLIIIAGWVLLHLIIISKFPHWWAGGSYGPRFMVDILPAIFLLLVIFLLFSYRTGSLFKKRFLALFFIITIPISIYFNAVQGLYNIYSGYLWNANPNIDKHPEYLFDWQYPQFLHNRTRHEARISVFTIESMNAIKLQESFRFDSKEVTFVGWSGPEKNQRWSLGHSSSLVFKLANDKDLSGIFKLHISTLGNQEIKLTINQHYIGSQAINSWDAHIVFKFDKSFLKQNDANIIKFEFPNAHKPDNGDQRVLAMALKSFRIE